jgi:hypothetical protein
VNVEGPEFNQDFSYFVTDMEPKIAAIEQGIPISQFNEAV